MLDPKEIVSLWKKELETTKKVIQAIPEDQLDFTPHKKSMTARQLMRVFLADTVMAATLARGRQVSDPYEGVAEIETIAGSVDSITVSLDDFVQAMDGVTAEFLAEEIEVWTIKNTRYAWIMAYLSDIIHHRGQMSVYIRLAGGLVPSIYGPSADDREGFPDAS